MPLTYLQTEQKGRLLHRCRDQRVVIAEYIRRSGNISDREGNMAARIYKRQIINKTTYIASRTLLRI